MSIVAQAERIRAGTLSPVAALADAMDRIAALDPQLSAFICLNEHARARAEACEREVREGRALGKLHGVPIAIKDNMLTADMPTTAGTLAAGAHFPQRDSAVAARLRAAGAILIGKTRTHEYAWGTETPPTRNPWDLSCIPGGSSGGSAAAVAAGLCAAAMGSDTGGSIRIPASFCGVVGLKPTFGRISRDGIVPHSWSLDHAGPLTRSVADAALLLGVLAGADPADPATLPEPTGDYLAAATGAEARGLRLVVVRNHFFGRNSAAVETAVERAIDWYAANGATIRYAELPNLDVALGAIFAIELASSAAYHDDALRRGRVAGYSEDVRGLVEMGRLVTGADLLKAEQFRRVLAADFTRLMAEADIIIGPTEPVTAPRVGQHRVEVAGGDESTLAATWRLTYPYNLTGMPAISLPCGFDEHGLPIGLQLAAKPFDEEKLLRAAAAYEHEHDWKDRQPSFGSPIPLTPDRQQPAPAVPW